MLEQVFDFNRDVVGNARKLLGKGMGDPLGMTNAIEEIRVAESNVPRAGCDLRAHVREDNVGRDDSKAAVVNRHDRAVTAMMLTSATGFGVSNGSPFTGYLKCRVSRERGKPVA